MAINEHFRYNRRSEQNLFEDLVIEAIQMYGQDVFYLPREVINKDKVFLDDVPSRFGNAYKVNFHFHSHSGSVLSEFAAYKDVAMAIRSVDL